MIDHTIHFRPQIDPTPAGPMMLFFLIEGDGENDKRADRTAYEGTGKVNIGSNLTFVRMEGALPVFRHSTS